MKTCPVCHAKAFDDADICFGCMHRFEDDSDDAREPVMRADVPAEFSIRFTSMQERPGEFTWKCAVEV